ncbi:putative capsular biosynthesis protein [Haemophilus sputorum HK 2154]|uniref:DUF4422 domain-containing protein n=1 Tax=Haemophilus sputorum TaxID=1078480 RepID=UPI0002489462|nr:DUF4422 domain-containing protein [Haemophilus sputorum]EJP30625.1 putative capsular biosynthesis protein [Haemophilus sputorum HK 2154]
MQKLTVLVITHKDYEFPHSACYRPLFVGGVASGLKNEDFYQDNSGINIAEKNSSFCELTGLYWAWKNGVFENNQYVGLVHYRRYFSGKALYLKKKQIASESELLSILDKCDVILPRKRNYFIESIYSHYQHAHHIKDLDITRTVITELQPEYLKSFDTVMQGRKLHLYNMFVMSSEKASEYCLWLFSILFELEKRLDITQYDNYQKRVFGFIAERLFNVWVLHNQLNVKFLPVVNLEGENLLKKAFGMIKRRIVKK